MILGLHAAAEAFLAETYQTRSGGIARQRWASDEVTYRIDEAGSDDMPTATAIAILRESFDVCNQVNSSSLQLIDAGISSGRAPTSTDCRNLIDGARCRDAADTENRDSRSGRRPFRCAATSEKVFLSDIGTNEIIALNLDGDIITRVQGPDSPHSLAVSPDGRTLHSTSFTKPQPAVFDTQTMQLASLMNLPLTGSFALDLSPGGGKLYVTGHLDNTVVVVDAFGLKTLTSQAIADNPRGLSFSPDGTRVMVTSAESDQIHLCDTKSDAIIGSCDVSGRPRGIAVIEPPRSPEDVLTSVLEQPLPTEFSLTGAFPNPSNSTIQVEFTIPERTAGSGDRASILMYDILGQRVRTLVNGLVQTGSHKIAWDGKDGAANTVTAGT